MQEIKLIKGDITKLKVDAIVNAANNKLMGGGGVDGAIHSAGGPTIMKECRKIGYCETGKAVVTHGGSLPAKYIIHTVGPVWIDGNSEEPRLLRDAYTNSLKLAESLNIKTVAFPNISTGVYGYPKEKAVKIAVESTSNFLQTSGINLHITFVCFDEVNYSLYKQELAI